jgi:hypothetical protein
MLQKLRLRLRKQVSSPTLLCEEELRRESAPVVSKTGFESSEDEGSSPSLARKTMKPVKTSAEKAGLPLLCKRPSSTSLKPTKTSAEKAKKNSSGDDLPSPKKASKPIVKAAAKSVKSMGRQRSHSMEDDLGRKESGDRLTYVSLLPDTLWLKVMRYLDWNSVGRLCQAW